MIPTTACRLSRLTTVPWLMQDTHRAYTVNCIFAVLFLSNYQQGRLAPVSLSPCSQGAVAPDHHVSAQSLQRAHRLLGGLGRPSYRPSCPRPQCTKHRRTVRTLEPERLKHLNFTSAGLWVLSGRSGSWDGETVTSDGAP